MNTQENKEKTLVPYYNSQKVSQFMDSPGKIIADEIDSKEFKYKLLKHFKIVHENLILKHVCDELERDFMLLKMLANITNITEKEFLEMLVLCFVDNIDKPTKKILVHTYRKYTKNESLKQYKN